MLIGEETDLICNYESFHCFDIYPGPAVASYENMVAAGERVLRAVFSYISYLCYT